MSFIRHVVVLDAVDVNELSTFWAGFLDGRVVDDDERFHCVIDCQGEWVMGVQHAPDHTPPRWPDGNPQQVHIDFHVTEPAELHERAIALGAKLLHDGDMSATKGHRVYADPAGHPFCIGWGHPDADALRRFLEQNPTNATVWGARHRSGQVGAGRAEGVPAAPLSRRVVQP